MCLPKKYVEFYLLLFSIKDKNIFIDNAETDRMRLRFGSDPKIVNENKRTPLGDPKHLDPEPFLFVVHEKRNICRTAIYR